MNLETLRQLNSERRQWLADIAARHLLGPEAIDQSMDEQARELAQRHRATMERMDEVCSRLGLSEGREGKAALVLAFENDTTESIHAEVDNSQGAIEVNYFVSDLDDTAKRDPLPDRDIFDNRFGADGTGVHVILSEGEASWNSWWEEDITLGDKQRVLSFAKDQVGKLEDTSLMLMTALTPGSETSES